MAAKFCNTAKCREGTQGDIELVYSITSSAVARSEGKIATLFEKRVSFDAPRTGGGYQTFWVRLTVASHRVYGWCRPRIPWIKAPLIAVCPIAV